MYQATVDPTHVFPVSHLPITTPFDARRQFYCMIREWANGWLIQLSIYHQKSLPDVHVTFWAWRQSSVAVMLDRFWTGIDQDQIHLTDRTAGIDRKLLSGLGRSSPCVALHQVVWFCVCRRFTRAVSRDANRRSPDDRAMCLWPRYVVLCCVMLCCVVLCYVMLCCVMLCCVMLCYLTWEKQCKEMAMCLVSNK